MKLSPVVDTAGDTVQVGVRIDGADTAAAKQLQGAADGGVIGNILQGLEDDGVMGNDHISAPAFGLPADSLEGVQGHQNFYDFLTSAAAEQTHIVPAHFHVRRSQGFHKR